jgi:hypothetical protein
MQRYDKDTKLYVWPGETAKLFYNCTPGYDGAEGVWGTCSMDAYLNEFVDMVKNGVSASNSLLLALLLFTIDYKL